MSLIQKGANERGTAFLTKLNLGVVEGAAYLAEHHVHWSLSGTLHQAQWLQQDAVASRVRPRQDSPLWDFVDVPPIPRWAELSMLPRLGVEAHPDRAVADAAEHWHDQPITDDMTAILDDVFLRAQSDVVGQLRVEAHAALSCNPLMQAGCRGDDKEYRILLAQRDPPHADLRLQTLMMSHPMFNLGLKIGHAECALHARRASALYSHSQHAYAGAVARRAMHDLTMCNAIVGARNAEHPVLPPELITAVAQFVKPSRAWTWSSEKQRYA